MAINVPSGVKGYWGSIVSAASSRAGIGGAFQAVNDARSAAGEEPLTGVDAISMGQLYSLAVQQRNAGEAFQAVASAIQNATGAERNLLYNQSLDATFVTQTINSAPDAVLFTEPTFRAQYQVTDDTTGETSYRWINLGNELPNSIGELWDTVNELNDLSDEAYGTTTTPTGFTQVFIV